jgi:hypothetical protein
VSGIPKLAACWTNGCSFKFRTEEGSKEKRRRRRRRRRREREKRVNKKETEQKRV